ncbi:hypothetical protein QQZ08_007932 [Neonectria magnoliae]|uniref:Uncharacterized protein n=1 Tax=Neonectria magnoliae TaxID=2732573 RepID=A0ABR1HXE2_9HYPO
MDPKEGVIKRPGSLSNAENASTVEGFQVEYVDPNVTHFKKEMGWFSILAAGFDSLATWVTFPSTLLVSFVYGGPYCTIWGLIATGVIFLPIAITICELVAVYPTVGGQYHWSAILAPRKYHREIVSLNPSVSQLVFTAPPNSEAQQSYACGYLSWFSWIALTAAGAGGLGNYVVALIKWKNPEYAVQKYQVFLIYQFGNIWNFIINAYCSSALPKVYKAGFVFSITSCVTIFIAVLAAQKKKNTSSFVWTDVNNITGWADGLQFIIALSGPTVMFCAIDGAVHLVEDTKRPAKVIPRTILVSLILSFTIAIGFSLAMLYCISDFEAALASPTGFPIFEIWRQAMGSDAWAVTFIVFLLIMVPVSVLPLVQIVSRMTWSLANDKGLLFSSYLSQVSERHKTPIPALAFNTTLVFLIGCLYLISNTGGPRDKKLPPF